MRGDQVGAAVALHQLRSGIGAEEYLLSSQADAAGCRGNAGRGRKRRRHEGSAWRPREMDLQASVARPEIQCGRPRRIGGQRRQVRQVAADAVEHMLPRTACARIARVSVCPDRAACTKSGTSRPGAKSPPIS